MKKQLSETSFKLEKTTETVMKLQDRLENTSSSHSTNSKKLEEVQRDYDNLRQLHDEREKLYTSLKEESAARPRRWRTPRRNWSRRRAS